MRNVSLDRINAEAVIQVLILWGFALFFYSTIRSGDVLLYVHPRIVPYMKFGIAVMVFISFFVARTVFKPQRRKGKLLPYLLFIIPLTTAFVIPARVIDMSALQGSNFKSTQATKSVKNAGGASTSQEAGSGGEETYGQEFEVESTSDVEAIKEDFTEGADEASNEGYSSSEDGTGTFVQEEDAQTELKLQGDTILVDNEKFLQWNDEIYNNMEKYEGKRIRIQGKVWLDKEMKETEFAVVRFMMACCTADLQPTGLICSYEKVKDLKSDSWVEVNGTIRLEPYQGEEYPVIDVESVQNAEKPKDEYVYP